MLNICEKYGLVFTSKGCDISGKVHGFCVADYWVKSVFVYKNLPVSTTDSCKEFKGTFYPSFDELKRKYDL